MAKRIAAPKLQREMGRCSVCPAGREASIEIVAINHKDAPLVDVGGAKVRRWFGFCRRCARLVGKAADRTTKRKPKTAPGGKDGK